jgi:hypothetical protein
MQMLPNIIGHGFDTGASVGSPGASETGPMPLIVMWHGGYSSAAPADPASGIAIAATVACEKISDATTSHATSLASLARVLLVAVPTVAGIDSNIVPKPPPRKPVTFRFR